MESLVRPLTLIGIIGLLMSVGLKTSVQEIMLSARQYGLVSRSMLANLVFAPAAILLIAMVMNLPIEISIGLVLVAAAPFAPMAPAFAGMAKGHLPTAGSHLVIYSMLAVIVCPLICKILFLALPGAGDVQIDLIQLAKSLVVSVFLPLSLGIAIKAFAPKVADRMLHPIEVMSRVAILAVVGLVLYLQFEVLKELGVTVLLALVLATEIPLWIGYWLGGPGQDTRRSLAMGTGVRNMGIAMIIATGSFADSPVLTTVIAYSLVMIILGIAHAHYWEAHPPQGLAVAQTAGGAKE